MSTIMRDCETVNKLPLSLVICREPKETLYMNLLYDYVYDHMLYNNDYKKNPLYNNCIQIKTLMDIWKKKLPKTMKFDENRLLMSENQKDIPFIMYNHALATIMYKLEVTDLNTITKKTQNKITKYSKYTVEDILFEEETELQNKITKMIFDIIDKKQMNNLLVYHKCKHLKTLVQSFYKNVKTKNVHDMDYIVYKLAIQNVLRYIYDLGF